MARSQPRAAGIKWAGWGICPPKISTTTYLTTSQKNHVILTAEEKFHPTTGNTLGGAVEGDKLEALTFREDGRVHLWEVIPPRQMQPASGRLASAKQEPLTKQLHLSRGSPPHSASQDNKKDPVWRLCRHGGTIA